MSEGKLQTGGAWPKIKELMIRYNIVLVFIAVFIICSIAAPRFATWDNVMAIARNSSYVGMIALGMTFVIITGGIDLSSGHALAASGVVFILLLAEGISIPVAILACLATAVLIGLVNGLIITRFKLPPFIVTLAIGIGIRSIALYATRGATVTSGLPKELVKGVTDIGNGSLGIIPIPFFVFVLSAIVLHFVLTYTKFGTYVYAVGGNEKAARYSGINVNRIKLYCYMLVGLCVGIAATMDLSRMAAVAATTAGSQYEFDAITAVIVGGTSLAGGKGRIVGTVVGVLIIGIVSNIMLMMNISPYLSGAVKGAVILLAVLLQKQEKQS